MEDIVQKMSSKLASAQQELLSHRYPTKDFTVDDAVMDAAVVVESREAALRESGDVLKSGAQIYAELGELLAGSVALPAGRRVYKALGIGAEDVAVARLIFDKMMRWCLSVKMEEEKQILRLPAYFFALSNAAILHDNRKIFARVPSKLAKASFLYSGDVLLLVAK